MKNARVMTIAYVAMQFPAPSETFASLDVETLRSQGHKVSVYGMRVKHKRFTDMMLQRGHANLNVQNFSACSIIYFFIFIICHPFITVSLLAWIFKSCYKEPKHLLKSLILFPSAISIFSSVFKNKPDVVHLFWGHYPSMVGYLVRRFIPSTTVSQFLGAHDLMAAYPGSAQLARKADIIFTHSHSNLSRLNAIGIDSNVINVVVRGTKLDFPFEGDIDKFDSLKKPIFLTASRLIKEKGVDNVLKIFSNILNIYPEAILFIAGEGSFKYDLIKLAKSYSCINQIEFLGHLNQIELIKYMAKAHFFLLMSRYPSERLPNVVKEAMYQRCVVVTTDTDGIDELVENRVSGFVVKSGDYIAGINCVVECLKDVDKAKNIANQAHQTVKENFDVNMSMRKYIDLWQSSILRKNLL